MSNYPSGVTCADISPPDLPRMTWWDFESEQPLAAKLVEAGWEREMEERDEELNELRRSDIRAYHREWIAASNRLTEMRRVEMERHGFEMSGT